MDGMTTAGNVTATREMTTGGETTTAGEVLAGGAVTAGGAAATGGETTTGGAVTAARGATTAGVKAIARIAARADGRRGTVLPVLESDGPLALRRTRGSGDEARVMLVGAMSGPLGGDRFAVEAKVGEGARLRVGSAAATIALPGQAKGEARYDVRIDIAAGGELRWLPEQLISAQGSDLRVSTRVELAADARLVFREEQVLGRAGEEPGRLGSRLSVWSGGRPLLDQEVACGPGAPGGWDGPAVLGGYRAMGQLLVVRPEFAEKAPGPRVWGESAALTPLAGPAVLVSALAPDALRLRRVLDEALAELDG
ncbi:urease accessory protein UreD [Streptomyces sp. CA-210063]|uniref:urease accessory protein UreD n=1 Tax=Streptomyces sp. CA-210063 TaxID=2801029 RepID=UPI00214C8CDE|nr:urease accessory protein UreD [Streptomyces sp. CA-210063]UUU35474.1 urease accessory protein UreD [Streptomyces sp. CA-210063]